MRDDPDENGKPLPDAVRLTRVGRFLRRSNLDEVPELINMMCLPYYSPREQPRHEVRPVITGWAQVNDRNAAGWGERLEMDVWCVTHQSFWLDVRVLVRTVAPLVTWKGLVVDPRGRMLDLDEQRRSR